MSASLSFMLSLSHSHTHKHISFHTHYLSHSRTFTFTRAHATKTVKKCKDVKDCVYKGVNELDDSCCKYLIEVTCNPINKRQVRRDTLRSMLEVMEKNNVSVPYNQIDVHQK